MYDHNYVKATYSINRRNFLATIGATYGTLAVPWLEVDAAESNQPTPGRKHGANVRAVFLYPPSATFSNDPDGWWSWPGNEFDAEGRQKRYTAALKEIENVSNYIADITQKMAESATLQAEGATQIRTNMGVIREITVQTKEGTNQSAASIDTLAGMVDELNKSVAGFRLPG